MFQFAFLILSVLFLIKVYQKFTIGRDDSNTCLIGKTAIVTGGNRGLGYETAIKLASRGCKVIIADIVDATESVKDIIKETNNDKIVSKFIDLASHESIRKFANEISQSEKRLDILINNAGSLGFEGVYTDNGVLKSSQINYFGPFLLTHLLIGLLKKTPDSRIVFVSSSLAFIHNISSIKDVNKPGKTKYKLFEGVLDYSNNKLLTLIAARKFAEKLKKHEVCCVAVNPGLVHTALSTTTVTNSVGALTLRSFNQSIYNLLLKTYGKSIIEGVQTTLYCALSPNVKKSVLGFYLDCREFKRLPSLALNEKFCDELWIESERLSGLKPNEKLE